MQGVPHPGRLPVPQAPPAGHATATAHLGRQHLPGDAGLEHKDDPGQGGAVGDAWSATLGLGCLSRQQRGDESPQFVADKRLAHGASVPCHDQVLKGALVLQRHFSIESREPAFVVAAPGVGLAASAPAGPMQPECLLGGIMQYHAEQTPHLRHRHRDQAGAPPFSPSAAAARVTARKAWASRHSVICRYHPTQRRTSY
jgi:hypothetical protein